jgi:hypothetical protein
LAALVEAVDFFAVLLAAAGFFGADFFAVAAFFSAFSSTFSSAAF